MASSSKPLETGSETRGTPAAPETATARDNRVPDWAENMEHTLRRIAAEKEAKRAEKPGLYR